jgi:hypothetical protein
MSFERGGESGGHLLFSLRRLPHLALGLEPIVDIVTVLVAALLEPAIGSSRNVALVYRALAGGAFGL